MYEEHGTSFLVEDYAVVAPGFEDRGYKSGDNWMALIHEFVYDNKYNIVEAPHWVDAAHHSLDACFGNHTRPYVFVYPYRWSIAFDDGTSWIIHDPGTDQDAVWTDTFKIYDFHGKPVYIGGIFIMVDNGNAPSKRIYFMYYEGKFYLEEGVEPDHNCIWFGCYEHDVYGTAEGLDLALNREDEPAQGYGNGKCRAVGKYDSLWTQHSVNAGEEITEEV
jgi:hypothetical protein